MNIVRKQYGEDYFETLAYKQIPNSQRDKNRLREILTYKQEGKLLEIGCGTGELLKMAQGYFDVEGMDISRYAIAPLKRSFGKKVWRKDIEAASLTPERYDVIAIFNVLEHLGQPGKVIDKIYRGLRNRGIAIGSVPLNASLVGRVHTALTNLFDRTHCSTYPPHLWRALFKASGFRRVHFFGEIMLGRNLGVYIRNGLWKHSSFNLMFLCEK